MSLIKYYQSINVKTIGLAILFRSVRRDCIKLHINCIAIFQQSVNVSSYPKQRKITNYKTYGQDDF